MTEVEGWGAASFLPPRVARMQALAEVKDQAEARAAERERENRRDELHQRAQVLARVQAEQRGEDISAVQLLTGSGGRTIGDVLAEAVAAADRQDAITAARMHREGTGPPTHVDFAEPVLIQRSETGRRMANIRRRFTERLEAKRALDRAERAAEASKNDYGYVGPAPQRSHRAGYLTAGTQRAGGPEPTFGPYNVPWSTVSQWIGQGWTP